MRALAAIVTAAILVAGCGATSSADPYAGLPSNACGGFHLKIVNHTDGQVRVTLNASSSYVVSAGATQTINASFSTPRPPQLPWDVVITDDGGRQLFNVTMPGPVDQKVTLSDAAPVQTPFDLREGC